MKTKMVKKYVRVWILIGAVLVVSILGGYGLSRSSQRTPPQIPTPELTPITFPAPVPLAQELIAFCGYPGPDQTWDLFTARGDGSNVQRFEQTDWPQKNEGCISLNRQYFVVDGLTWSPDGDRLAFTMRPGISTGYANVVSVNNTGQFGKPQRIWIYNRTDFDEHIQLNWSPRDDRIAFFSEARTGPEPRRWHVYVATMDGSQYLQLTHLVDQPNPLAEPVWSPDAKSIAVAVIRPHNGVGVLAVDGSHSLWLTDKTVPEFPETKWIPFLTPPLLASSAPVWYPDSSMLLFLVALHGDEPTSLYRVNRDGSALVKLVEDNVYSPALSPDGKWIAYVLYENPLRRKAKIVVANANAQEPKIIVELGAPLLTWSTARDLSWSPDGTRLAFAANPNGNMDLFVVNADGTELRNITGWAGDEIAPKWRPRK